ncbi:hypothetical protein AZI86_11075 [Bdellovibrio bacteriovorus]|uniref:Cyclase n=1 Tax=Bdellovibrio bacteriovorus TaxID=959 RepID=A0A150WLH7_BDEBC|nr:cyclase family protein [Bdellovibrio bacteriovorus]KYG64742.1 hypothetical protein AZI86_11075 [Bdellovibrio bacteriovorus]
MKKTIFLSHYLNETTPGYGGKQGFFKKISSDIAQGASSNSQEWTLSNHIGTHIDLPLHFDSNGKCLNDYRAEEWIFRSPHLLDLPATSDQIIGPNIAFESVPHECDMLILRTGFEKHRNNATYWSNNPGLSPDLAIWLRTHRPNIKVLGFDFISITSYSNRPLGRLAHKEFLAKSGTGAPLRVIEDMKLEELQNSPSMVVVSPLLVDRADGAPVTVIAIC